ncbi:ATP-binding protein [Patescibacteria group bacterium]|nr:ATP-binding protein [Patescibacteria group bacterium]
MPSASKRFGGKATESPRQRFWTARAQLTLTYTAILAAILLISSSIIYSAFARRLESRFGRLPPRAQVVLPEGPSTPRPEEVLRDLTYSLIIVNSLLLILAAILSYWLAGLTLEPIEEAYHRQRRFLSDASHELRTPLAILQADIENTLTQPKVTNIIKEQAESQLEEIQRMGEIIKNLLILSRLDEKAIPHATQSTINLSELISLLVKRFQPLAKQMNITLNETPLEKSLFVHGNEDLLQQAFSNLIKNAIAYNQKEGRVTVKSWQTNSDAHIEIEDTGIGIAPEDVDKVFDRFYRVDKSRSRQTGGSGLGLSIVQSVITQFHGSIEVKSELERGTTIHIKLPLAHAS